MADKVKGITLSLSLDTAQFKSALSEVSRQSKLAEEKVKELQKQLKLNPESTTLLNEYKEAVKDLASTSKTAKDKLQEFYDTSKDSGLEVTDARLEAVNKDLGVVTSRLNAANGRFTEFADSIEKAGDETKEADEKMDSIADTLKEVKDAAQGSLALDVLKTGWEVVTDLAKTYLNILKECASVYTDILKEGVEYNATMETYEVNLRAMLNGDQERTDALISSMKTLAAQSGFGVDSLISATKSIIATGVSADDAEATIKALGDAIAYAGGSNDELERMATNLQQIKNQGKTTATDLRQFATAGIPIYQLLAEYLEKSADEIAEMQSNGEITFEYISGALQQASSDGGTFFGAMERNADTLNGQINLLKMNWQELQGVLAQDTTTALKDSFLPQLNESIVEIKEAFLVGPDEFKESIRENISELADNVMTWLPDLIEGFTVLLEAIVDGVVENKERLQPLVLKMVQAITSFTDLFTDAFWNLGVLAAEAFVDGCTHEGYFDEFFDTFNALSAGGQAGMRSGGLGIQSGGLGTVTVNSTINVTNTGAPIDSNTIRQWSSEITDAVSQELARRN